MRTLRLLHSLAASLVLAFLINSAAAATLTVTTTADSGAGSLRQAIADAAPGDTITFDTGIIGERINLLNGPLDIAKNLTIDAHARKDGVVLHAGGKSRVLAVADKATVTLSGIHISGAHQLFGAALSNAGTLTMVRCAVTANTATVPDCSGINNRGTLTMVDCTVSGFSQAEKHCRIVDGGGIYNSGTLTMTGCTLAENSAGRGGGLYNTGTVSMTACTLAGNSGKAGGGGIHNTGTVSLVACTISDNYAKSGSAITNDKGGTVTLRSTLVGKSTPHPACGPYFNNIHGTTISQGYNLCDDWGPVAITATDLTKTIDEINLNCLYDAGGPTDTCRLLDNSAAFDHGDPDPAYKFDQRGVRRPYRTRADIGAFEDDTPATTLPAVSLISTAATPAQARSGDTLTLTFTASAEIKPPTVILAGQTATVTGSKTTWTATVPVGADTPEGAVTFSISFSDLIGHAGVPVSATTDGSRVTIEAAPSNRR
ncbi:MAG: hypothetical protein KA118_19665 [Verrucomicrobia bacterium]|nr:hypothetical protein [Verrucomicrobiota bacterium]